ncbi:hypothetical protein [Alishewanella phage vB_AspM_Slickus01]|nr:hypothetical protein [Alishewanella phage vB_AspM_Slickus01]
MSIKKSIVSSATVTNKDRIAPFFFKNNIKTTVSNNGGESSSYAIGNVFGNDPISGTLVFDLYETEQTDPLSNTAIGGVLVTTGTAVWTWSLDYLYWEENIGNGSNISGSPSAFNTGFTWPDPNDGAGYVLTITAVYEGISTTATITVEGF